MAKYAALLNQINAVITQADDLLNGVYDPLDDEEPDLIEDTETIRDSAQELHDALVKLQQEGTDEDISEMAHDLRGMINGILGWADIICQGLDGDLPEAQTPVYKSLFDAGMAILLQVDTLIDFARMRIDVLKYTDDEDVDISEIFSEPMRIQTNTPSLSVVTPDHIETTAIKGDTHRMRQAIYHILFALDDDRRVQVAQPNGSIAITASGKPRFCAPMQQVFEPFQCERQDDLGLGLPLAKGLIEHMGGSITLEVADDTAAFVVKMPAS
jgi:signal transduction histidine kinase